MQKGFCTVHRGGIWQESVLPWVRWWTRRCHCRIKKVFDVPHITTTTSPLSIRWQRTNNLGSNETHCCWAVRTEGLNTHTTWFRYKGNLKDYWLNTRRDKLFFFWHFKWGVTAHDGLFSKHKGSPWGGSFGHITHLLRQFGLCSITIGFLT